MTRPPENKERITAKSGIQSASFTNGPFLYHLSQQQRMQAALHHRDQIALVRDQQRSGDILAAAVQHQLVASLSSSSLPFFSPNARPHLANNLANGILSRPGSSNSSFIGSLQGASQIGLFSVSSKADNASDTASGECTTTTQIPCQARGMSTDHNSLTAYFEIPSDATHGQHLFCSHPTCRAAGVKFRYCFFCKKPVTKQNFRSRHLHANLLTPEGRGKTPRSANKKRSLENATANEESTETKKLMHRDAKIELGVEPSMEMRVQARNMDLHNSKGNVEGCSQHEIPNSIAALKLVVRRRRWGSLLTERPQGLETMNEWIEKVLVTSDTSQPLDIGPSILSDGAISTRNSVDQVAAWFALLENRPSGSAMGAEVTAWLSQVLAISCIDYEKSEGENGSVEGDVNGNKELAALTSDT